jgi:hypothetical protein
MRQCVLPSHRVSLRTQNKGELNETTIAVMCDVAGRDNGPGAGKILAIVQSLEPARLVQSVKSIQSVKRLNIERDWPRERLFRATTTFAQHKNYWRAGQSQLR